jgi:hypothetical protein
MLAPEQANHNQDLENARAEIESLRADLQAALVRLSVAETNLTAVQTNLTAAQTIITNQKAEIQSFRRQHDKFFGILRGNLIFLMYYIYISKKYLKNFLFKSFITSRGYSTHQELLDLDFSNNSRSKANKGAHQY